MTISLITYAQKHDENWMWGKGFELQDSADYPLAGNAQSAFPNNIINSWAQYRGMAFKEVSTSMSDAEGNLLFYTNGMRIFDSTSQLIVNGDRINYGQVWENIRNNASFNTAGYFMISGTYILSFHPLDSVYTMVHIRVNDSFLSGNESYTVLYSQIVRHNNIFEVTVKNKVLSTIPACFGNMCVCRHANGRDWWMIFEEFSTNCHHKYIISKDTIVYAGVQCLGGITTGGWSKFSWNGEKYMRHSRLLGIDVFNFDRCSGELSNLQQIPSFMSDLGGLELADGADISPQGRFVYAATGYKVLQWDLANTAPSAKWDTVVLFDPFQDTIVNSGNAPYLPIYPQIGPNGYLYFSAAVYSRFLSYIEFPDEVVSLTNYMSRAVVLPKATEASPQFPNYRLGRLPGSACDTVYNDIKPLYAQAPKLNVYPNPAMDEVKLDYNWVEWEEYKDVRLEIIDIRGVKVMEQKVPQYSSWQQVSVERLAAGTYTVEMVGRKSEVGSQKSERVVQLAVAKLVKL